MIYGYIKDLGTYKGMSKNLDIAIDYILDKKYLNNHFGKNEILGDKVYFNCPEKPCTKVTETAELEAHKKYIDIHVVISGEEVIAYSDLENCELTKPYDEEGDYYLLKAKYENKFLMNSEKFLIFFADEPHLAMLAKDEPQEIKKVIFKVAV